jgi:hypothetical protein
MTEHSRESAEQELQAVADDYRAARAAVAAAEERAEAAVFNAKRAGLSQHDIARIMGDPWNREHNPQFPPTIDLQRPRDAE